MTKKGIFIGIAGLILVILWLLLNNFIPKIKKQRNVNHDQTFLKLVFKQANFLNALVLISLMILSLAIFGVSSSIFCIFVGLLYAPLLSIPLNIIGNTFDNLTRIEILRRLDKSKRMEKLLNYDEYFKHRFIGIFLAFSIPFIPSALVNYAYVQMKLPTRTRIFSATNWNDPTLRYLCCQWGFVAKLSSNPTTVSGNTCSLAVYLTSNLLYPFQEGKK